MQRKDTTILLALLLLVDFSVAVEWDDFANNLASDLAPLITLFGEQVTKQFLSESLTIWDNIIFAMAPLGLLTAVVSVIRVCGSPSLRAFIGRAQESPALAEAEILSCTSETTAELFNDRGIARVFGEPQLLEVVIIEDPVKPGVYAMSQLWHPQIQRDFRAWEEVRGPIVTPSSILNNGGAFRKYPPNLSINLGIVKLPAFVSYGAAFFGLVLQAGVLVFAALTQYQFPEKFSVEKKEPAVSPGAQSEPPKSVENYAFPLAFIGTLMVCLGMFLCAYIIERSTYEVRFRKMAGSKSRIYWVQPGDQKIGDQVFASFLGASDDPEYIKSFRSNTTPTILLWPAVIITVVGFVTQFVGLRALHASVIFAQMGATLMMAIIRAMLRAQRMSKTQNLMPTGPESTSAPSPSELPEIQNEGYTYKKLLNGHELDILSLQLFDINSVFISPDVKNNKFAKIGSGSEYTDPYGFSVTNPITARRCLVGLTSDWKGVGARKAAESLQRIFGATLDALDPILQRHFILDDDDYLSWTVTMNEISNRTTSRTPILPQSLQVDFEKGRNSWGTSKDLLEGILGVWVLSVIAERELASPYGSIVYRVFSASNGSSNPSDDDSFRDAMMWYKVWASSSGSYRYSDPEPRPLTYSPDQHLVGSLALSDYKQTSTTLAFMPEQQIDLAMIYAQELYTYFLMFLFQEIRITESNGAATTVRSTPLGTGVFHLQNTWTEQLAEAFENSGLGTKDDAYLCIFSVLRILKMFPCVKQTLPLVKQQAENYKSRGEWEKAIELLQWFGEYLSHEGDINGHKAILDFYFDAVMQNDAKISTLGCAGIGKILKETTPGSNLESINNQYGWAALTAAEELGLVDQVDELIRHGAKKDFIQGFVKGMTLFDYADSEEDEDPADEVIIRYLIAKDPEAVYTELGEMGRTVLHVAIRNKKMLLCQYLRHCNVDPTIEDWKGRTAYSHVAQHPESFDATEWIWDTDASIAVINGGTKKKGRTAIMYAARAGNIKFLEKCFQKYPKVNINNHDFKGMSSLTHAVNGVQPRAVAMLLRFGAEVNARDPRTKETALHYVGALRDAQIWDDPLNMADMEMADLLLLAGADIHAVDATNLTPLHSAARGGCLDIVSRLIRQGADVNALDASSRTPLDCAVNFRRSFVISELLNRGSYITMPLSVRSPAHRHLAATAYARIYRSAIPLAVETGNLELVKLLINKKYLFLDDNQEIDGFNSFDDGFSGVLVAFERGETAICEYLLAKGAKITPKILKTTIESLFLKTIDFCRDASRLECILAACEDFWTRPKSNLDDMPILRSKLVGFQEFWYEPRADLEGNTPLHKAAMCGNAEVVTLMLKQMGEDFKLRIINQRNNEQHTAFSLAAYANSVPTLEALLKNGMRMPHISKAEDRFLGRFLVSNLEVRRLEELAKAFKAEDSWRLPEAQRLDWLLLEACKGKKRDPMFESISLSKRPPRDRVWDSRDSGELLDVIKMLLDHGSDPRVTNHDNENVLLLASSYGCIETLKFFLARGNTEYLNKTGGTALTRTPLMSAILRCDFEMADVLLAAGADLNGRDDIDHGMLAWAVVLVSRCRNENIDFNMMPGERPEDSVSYFLNKSAELGVYDKHELLRAAKVAISRGLQDIRDMIAQYIVKKQLLTDEEWDGIVAAEDGLAGYPEVAEWYAKGRKPRALKLNHRSRVNEDPDVIFMMAPPQVPTFLSRSRG